MRHRSCSSPYDGGRIGLVFLVDTHLAAIDTNRAVV